MISQYDKAGAAAIGGALASVIGHFADLDPGVTASLATLLAGIFAYFIPNKAPSKAAS